MIATTIATSAVTSVARIIFVRVVLAGVCLLLATAVAVGLRARRPTR